MKNAKNYTRKEYTQIINQYILDCIPSNAEILNNYGIITVTDKDRVNFVMSCFQSEHCHEYNMKRWPNTQTRFAEWLMRLPVLTVAFENYRIIEIAKQWGSLPADATEKQEDKILANWFNYMAAKFLQLHAKLNK
jgi:hypothetical protein